MTLTARTCQQTGPAVIEHTFATTGNPPSTSPACAPVLDRRIGFTLLIATFNPERQY